MSLRAPQIPKGNGTFPIVLVVITANDLPASSAFYASVFGWQIQAMSAEVSAAMLPPPTPAALRAGMPANFPSMVPFIAVRDVESVLGRVVAAGGSVEKEPWNAPMIGKLARFREPGGAVFGLTSGVPPQGLPHVPMPIAGNPSPAAGALCHLELYSADRARSEKFFREVFEWGLMETMPNYTAFDPGVGVGGIFQSHTPGSPAVAYIYCTDVNEKLKAIESSGGKRMADAMIVPGMAAFGYFRDPSHSSMGLIGPA